jgi:hypothetical protein
MPCLRSQGIGILTFFPLAGCSRPPHKRMFLSRSRLRIQRIPNSLVSRGPEEEIFSALAELGIGITAYGVP